MSSWNNTESCVASWRFLDFPRNATNSFAAGAGDGAGGIDINGVFSMEYVYFFFLDPLNIATELFRADRLAHTAAARGTPWAGSHSTQHAVGCHASRRREGGLA